LFVSRICFYMLRLLKEWSFMKSLNRLSVSDVEQMSVTLALLRRIAIGSGLAPMLVKMIFISFLVCNIAWYLQCQRVSCLQTF
jgi:hypothetical protein